IGVRILRIGQENRRPGFGTWTDPGDGHFASTVDTVFTVSGYDGHRRLLARRCDNRSAIGRNGARYHRAAALVRERGATGIADRTGHDAVHLADFAVPTRDSRLRRTVYAASTHRIRFRLDRTSHLC